MHERLKAPRVTEALPPWLEGLQGPHLPAFILSDKPIIRIVAGPGSGKTTGLKRRVQRFVEGEGVPHGRIFVGTFTRAVAADLRTELGEDIKVTTLHSLAYELLRDHPAARQGYALRFLLAYEEQCLLYDVASEVTHLPALKDRQEALLRQQSARSERKALPDAEFAGAVSKWLREHGGMLIGEVVHLAITALEAEDIPRGMYDHVVVDEYQDLTAAEQELVELIWSRAGSLVVLGDDNQSIYGFRFNHPGGIGEFASKWAVEDFDDLGIPENRRCGECIVDIANQMMAEAGSSNAPMEARSGREGSAAFFSGRVSRTRSTGWRGTSTLSPRSRSSSWCRDGLSGTASRIGSVTTHVPPSTRRYWSTSSCRSDSLSRPWSRNPMI